MHGVLAACSMTSVEHVQPVDAATTPFDLGPVTNVITAIAALQLLQVRAADCSGQ